MVDPRGDPWEHDPGPPAGSGWAELFARTPNYRGLGVAALGRERFRWHFGPMFYRGRLDGSARVMVIGQEGAQDESLAHRSFTGGTGGRMQHFLGHLGIERSYLFLNTFVYPIFGQYTQDLRPLAQDLRSPIVAHRHEVFDKAAGAQSDVRLVVAVGRAAKESAATWVGAHGGAADPERLEQADTGSLSKRLRLVGVLHPGSASGPATEIQADFQRAIDLVGGWMSADAGWLPADPGASRDLRQPFGYASDPGPHRDFPFGICPRLGMGGTVSNRTDAQRGIRLFSAHGRYNAAGASLQDGSADLGSPDGYDDDPGDLPYEPPRARPDLFDPGPPADMSRLLAGGAPGLAWPDFGPLGVTSDPSFGAGPLYRGRLAGVGVVVLADQSSEDDLFAGRALCGEEGQRLQGLLEAAGLTTRYLILRTAPVDTLDLDAARRSALVDDARLRALHQEILGRVRSASAGLGALLALGPGARRLAPKVAPSGLPVIELQASSESGTTASWQAALDRLRTLTYARDVDDPTFTLPAGRGQVPRIDLPYGTPRWVGTSGDRGDRSVDIGSGRPSPDYLKLFLPAWVAALPPAPLSASESAAVAALRS